jgi:hypothetical protein
VFSAKPGTGKSIAVADVAAIAATIASTNVRIDKFPSYYFDMSGGFLFAHNINYLILTQNLQMRQS